MRPYMVMVRTMVITDRASWPVVIVRLMSMAMVMVIARVRGRVIVVAEASLAEANSRVKYATLRVIISVVIEA